MIPEDCARMAHPTLRDQGRGEHGMAAAARVCPVCSQHLADGGTCRNSLCRHPKRSIERIDAVASHSGAMQDVIQRYKYEGEDRWARVFGRLLVGWLDAHATGDPPELIVVNPTYVGPGEPGPGHVEAITKAAAATAAGHRWPFDVQVPAAVVKTEPTERSAGCSFAEKQITAAALREVLRIPDPARTAGRRILVVDDVCTTGWQLNAVADCLVREGRAASVRALVLARAPWR
jgi:predicted amidophosphoribosyltransferase